jgi:hypothetical protein
VARELTRCDLRDNFWVCSTCPRWSGQASTEVPFELRSGDSTRPQNGRAFRIAQVNDRRLESDSWDAAIEDVSNF